MIKSTIIIVLFFVLSIQIKGQNNDTINYNSFLTSNDQSSVHTTWYILRKIIQGKDLSLQRGDIYLGSWIASSSDKEGYSGKFTDNKSTSINAGDTIMYIGWYLIKGGGYCLRGIINHATGKVTLNKSSNILKVELLKPTYDKREIPKYTAYLKIIKWTSHEVILEDMLNPEKHRRYYFTKA